ncbi:MAG: hypothetical protein HQM09_19770 [Candidatus Riflebacteria bacterium]|nr:hypothetical protein [Candidatus Riflebacteria bacterium]
MARKFLANEEIRREGLQAVRDRLGAEGLVRFLQEFERGHSNYTKDRYQWRPEIGLEETVVNIEAFVAERKKPRRPRAKAA